MSGPEVAIATPDQFAIVLAIMDETAAWLVSKGMRQWRSPAPPDVRHWRSGPLIIGRGLGEWLIRAVAAELDRAGRERIRPDGRFDERGWYERRYSLARYEALCATIKREPL